ncbi:MAG: hypothetical protein KIPDCIKN_04346 [Haliscomenobacter sp.]|nr:hypothetical protein [Haliscomenobacter sp.]
MRTVTFLDIETAVDHAAPFEFDPTEVAIGSLKDPDKINAKIEAAKLAASAKRALCPLTARIVSYALAHVQFDEAQSPRVISRPTLVTDRVALSGDIEKEERRLLDALARITGTRHTLVGWNIHRFDIPMIITRAAVLGVACDPIEDCVRARWPLSQGVFDLIEYLAWVCPGMQNYKLSSVTKSFGCDVHAITGLDVPIDKAVAALRMLDPSVPHADRLAIQNATITTAEADMLSLVNLWKRFASVVA